MKKYIRSFVKSKIKKMKPFKKKYDTLLNNNFFKIFNNKIIKKNIGSYIASKNEISPIMIDSNLLNTNNIIYYPVINPFFNTKMWFCKKNRNFRINKFMIQEPKFKYNTIIAPWELDIIIIPLVAFDKSKNRLGMGKGFYDNALKFCKEFNDTIFIGIAFEEQECDNTYHDVWDIKMDFIITPKKIIS